jgi:hypothetical protein
MDIEKNFQETTRLKKEFQEKSKTTFNLRSSDRLVKSIEKKFRTTFIGALSYFEEVFGGLWGDREPESTLSPQQIRNRRLWEQVRTNVLNNGNNQLRAAQSEIAEYTVEWNKHTVQLRKDR